MQTRRQKVRISLYRNAFCLLSLSLVLIFFFLAFRNWPICLSEVSVSLFFWEHFLSLVFVWLKNEMVFNFLTFFFALFLWTHSIIRSFTGSVFFISTYIPEGQHIMYMGEPVHPWHYNCFSCK